MAHAPSDSDLLEAYKAGDDAAFRKLWVRHAGALRRFLRAHFGADVACEDLVQEAFLSLSQNAGLLRDPGAVRSYLMIAVRRLGFGERRRLQKCATVGLEAARHLEGPAVDHDRREKLGRVCELLERLSPRRRAAFVNCLEEFTVVESSRAMGVSPATIRRELRAARRLATNCVRARSRAATVAPATS